MGMHHEQQQPRFRQKCIAQGERLRCQIHVGWFPGGDAQHGGSYYYDNRVYSGYNLLSYGIASGFHPWDPNRAVPHAGELTGNQAHGAVNNLTVDGIGAGVISGNWWSSRQGDLQYPSTCTLPGVDYSAGHYGAASLQGAWVERIYHPSFCG